MTSQADERLTELYKLKYDVAVDLYRQRAKFIAARRAGLLEFLVHEIFGSDLIGSIACALDPEWQLIQIGKVKGPKSLLIQTLFPISPVAVNRTRKFITIWNFPVYAVKHGISNTCQNQHLWNGSSFYWGPYGCGTPFTSNSKLNVTTQQAVYGFVKDTTLKSRNPGVRLKRNTPKLGLQTQGEFELFRPYLQPMTFNSSIFTSEQTTNYNHSDGFQKVYNYGSESDSIYPNTGSVNSAQVTAFATSEKSYAQSVMAKNLDAMLARCVPTRRYYNLAYQVGELKDLPMTIRGTLAAWRDFERLVGKEEFTKAFRYQSWWKDSKVVKLKRHLEAIGIQNPLDKSLAELYLNFKFGWQSMYQSAVRLVKTPQRVTKEVNYLISRNGKFTNLATTKSWSEPVAAFPSVIPVTTVGAWKPDPAVPMTAFATRDIHLRCMCNVGVNFPPLSVPSLRSQLFYDKLGLYPSPGDLYDLVPWSWMLDWFVGLGDYIHVMDRINGTDSPINYGFMSYKSKTKVRAAWQMYYDYNNTVTTIDWQTGAQPVIKESIRYHTTLTFPYVMEYELRSSLSSIASVKQYNGAHLSGDQGTILGALLSKFT